jgi:effector-binding domain-containing protein
MAIIANIVGKEITFVSTYNEEMPMVAEVFYDKKLFDIRLGEISKKRKVIKQCQNGKFFIIIHVKELDLDKEYRINRLKENITLSKMKHEDQIMKMPTLKQAHVYCVIHNISAQQYGPLLESYIRIKFGYTKNKAEDCIGDCSKDGKNSEIKVSLGGITHKKFNFVQIRPSHDCETYILTAYHLNSENVEQEGELYIFRVPKTEIKKIIASYGGYAHRTIREYGKITLESLNDEKSMKEYALRPTFNDKCWKSLIPFRVLETEL